MRNILLLLRSSSIALLWDLAIWSESLLVSQSILRLLIHVVLLKVRVDGAALTLRTISEESQEDEASGNHKHFLH